MKKTQSLILTSGGLDSTACIAHYLGNGSEVECLFIEYGQASLREERSAITRISEFYGLNIQIVPISALPRWKTGEIPGRNALLITLALMTFRWQSGLISIGIHSGTNYADCSSEFMTSMQAVADTYYSGRVQIDAPFLNWTKAEVFHFAKLSNCPVEMTYSCEAGGVSPCRKCESCLDREVLYASA